MAQDYYKNRWLYGLLGIAVYYVGTVLGGAIMGVTDDLFDLGINFDSTLNLTLIAFAFGISFAYLVYILIKKQWKKSVVIVKDEIQDIGKTIDE